MNMDLQYEPVFEISEDIFNLVEQSFALPKYANITDFFKGGFELTASDVLKRFDVSYSPWILELCKWFDDPRVEKIYLVQGSQTGKTSFQMGALLYISQYVYGNPRVIWIQSTDDEAEQFIAKRLKPFLDEAGREDTKGKRWKNSYFTVFNSDVKVGAGQSHSSQRCLPCKYVIGDECGIWKTPLDYSWQRTRVFENDGRKGIYATTPPFDSTHHSWLLATAAAFYRWYVPCLNCEKFQAMSFANIKFREAKRKNGKWDIDKIREIARYECPFCGDTWDESKKLEIITQGKPVCVDPNNDYKETKPHIVSSKTMQISGLYSFFTSFGAIAATFIEKKQAGPESLKIFFTDELAESPKMMGKTHKQDSMRKYCDVERINGDKLWDCEFFTAGVDVQQKGELYCVVQGWRAGAPGSGHMLKYGVIDWKDNQGNPTWIELTKFMADYLDNMAVICIDASDGVVWKDVLDFCDIEGHPYYPLKEFPLQTIAVKKSETKDSDTEVYKVNSHMIKDYIESAFNRAPGSSGAWSFPANTSSMFFEHLANEHKVEEKRGTKIVKVWKPKYDKAPQHYFSAYVYSVAAMYLDRHQLIFSGSTEEKQQASIEPAQQQETTEQKEGVDWIGLRQEFWPGN